MRVRGSGRRGAARRASRTPESAFIRKPFQPRHSLARDSTRDHCTYSLVTRGLLSFSNVAYDELKKEKRAEKAPRWGLCDSSVAFVAKMPHR